MRDFDSNPSADQEERLPVHPWTILVGVLRRRRLLLSFAAASVLAGLVVALLFGGHVYQAQSVLLYRPETDGRSNDPALTVQTQAHMVLLDSNLEKTRQRLEIPVSLKQLAAACQVNTQPNTALIMIDVGWKSPEVAAKIANTLRDVFVYNQGIVRQASAVLEVRDLRSRIDELRARLKAIDDKWGELSDTSGLVDLEKETQNFLTELANAELLYDQARADKLSIEMQIRSAPQMLARAQPSGSAGTEALGDLNLRAARLRDSIHEDQISRAAQAELEGLKIQRDQKLEGFKQGFTPKAEYDKAEAAYQAQKERAIDTAQVKEWRSKISHLDQGILSTDGSAASSHDSQQKLFQLELDRIAADSKVEQFGRTVDRLRKKIAALPKVKRNFLTFSREADSNETELKALLEKLGRAERAQMAKSSEFVTIADATPPALPVRSRRTIIFLGVSAFGTVLGLGVVLAMELLNGTVRSAGEAAVKMPIPLLGIVPKIAGYRGLPKDPTERIPEPFRALALHVRRTVPKSGARLLFFSARPLEGVTTVIDHLAESLRRDHVSVLVRSAQAGSNDGDIAAGSHDIVLLDGPPILESIDSEVVAPSCDAAILVVASGVTSVSDITEAIARIRSTRVPIVGAVLNRVDSAYL
jgi:succinoglycan biosynthesis transport protein ExoP